MSTFGRLAKLASVTLAAAAAAAGLTSSAALASPVPAQPGVITWTVTPGGSFTAKSGPAIFTDTVSGAVINCVSANMTGSLKSGSGLPGKGLGTVKSLTFVTCTLAGASVSMSSGPVAWLLNAVSYKLGVMHGTITGIHFAITGSGCSAVVDGTGATARNGHVKITFTNKNDHLRILPGGGNLHIYDVKGCLGPFGNSAPRQIVSGDSASLAVCFLPVPSQMIVSSGDGGGSRPAMIGPPCKAG